MKEISIKEFYKLYQTKSSWRLIDVRETVEFDEAHIVDSINIPLSLLMEKHFLFLNTNKEYYIICKNGSRSFSATSFLESQGYKVTNIVEGIIRWPGKIIKTCKNEYY
jgi:rhodanese-related sulfurtransferase